MHKYYTLMLKAMVDVEERYRNYFRFLNALYDATDGSEIPSVSLWKVGERIGTGGQPSIETQNILKWLYGEGLAKERGMGGEIGITHQGIKEVEDARRFPNKDTQHFSPSIIHNVINNYGTIADSPIQQGNTDSTQTVTITKEQIDAIHDIISEMKMLMDDEELSTDQKAILDTEIKTLELQAKAKHPNWEAIKRSLKYVKPIATAVAVGAPLALKIISLLGGS